MITDNLGEGDSMLIHNILSEDLSNKCKNISFLKDEIDFRDMRHGGTPVARRVALQGEIIDETMPLYRTPTDYLLPFNKWTTTVEEIKKELEEFFGDSFNHVKIQLYRNGKDYITKHSDKTLDIKIGTKIVNLNLGATRHFALKNKKTAAYKGT